MPQTEEEILTLPFSSTVSASCNRTNQRIILDWISHSMGLNPHRIQQNAFPSTQLSNSTDERSNFNFEEEGSLNLLRILFKTSTNYWLLNWWGIWQSEEGQSPTLAVPNSAAEAQSQSNKLPTEHFIQRQVDVQILDRAPAGFEGITFPSTPTLKVGFM